MSTDEYIAARAEFVSWDAEINDLGKSIVEIGNAINQKRARFSFSNTGQGLPVEAMMSRDSVSADGSQWPSAQRIMETLARWHAARSAVDSAWHALSRDQQAALQPPPVTR
ncbi:MAG TPA: hypothetical protein VGM83_12245 [Devosiaceae bacterium]|jgi:hypothetical protein